MNLHTKIWDDFCGRMDIHSSAVPLFQCGDGVTVDAKTIGVTLRREVLCRSPQMEQMIISETETLVGDWKGERDEYDGLIYVMFLKDSGCVRPLYIGKTETIGKGDRNLSANIKSLHKDFSKFARWGDNYAYHIGDLSAVVLPGHDPNRKSKKYLDWADSLFVETPTRNPTLKKEVFFWTTAWNRRTEGIWTEFGETRLTFLEYLMIGVASSAFPELLLNREGQNRG